MALNAFLYDYASRAFWPALLLINALNIYILSMRYSLLEENGDPSPHLPVIIYDAGLLLFLAAMVAFALCTFAAIQSGRRVRSVLAVNIERFATGRAVATVLVALLCMFASAQVISSVWMFFVGVGWGLGIALHHFGAMWQG
jgi:hypothetical protein